MSQASARGAPIRIFIEIAIVDSCGIARRSLLVEVLHYLLACYGMPAWGRQSAVENKFIMPFPFQ